VNIVILHVLYIYCLFCDAIESSSSSAFVLLWLLFVDLFLEPVCDLCCSSVCVLSLLAHDNSYFPKEYNN